MFTRFPSAACLFIFLISPHKGLLHSSIIEKERTEVQGNLAEAKCALRTYFVTKKDGLNTQQYCVKGSIIFQRA